MREAAEQTGETIFIRELRTAGLTEEELALEQRLFVPQGLARGQFPTGLLTCPREYARGSLNLLGAV
jgi:hypothetical protein